jgi:hypothetical protein
LTSCARANRPAGGIRPVRTAEVGAHADLKHHALLNHPLTVRWLFECKAPRPIDGTISLPVAWVRSRIAETDAGEFYEIVGSDQLTDQPTDWVATGNSSARARHFLFYFRDGTFECISDGWRFESDPENALFHFSGASQSAQIR